MTDDEPPVEGDSPCGGRSRVTQQQDAASVADTTHCAASNADEAEPWHLDGCLVHGPIQIGRSGEQTLDFHQPIVDRSRRLCA